MPREKNPTLVETQKPAARKPMSRKKPAPAAATFVGLEQRGALIAEAAYFRAEKRGFAPGHELEDWLQAEAEVDARLLQSAATPQAQPPS
jgi:hypothetical protein